MVKARSTSSRDIRRGCCSRDSVARGGASQSTNADLCTSRNLERPQADRKLQESQVDRIISEMQYAKCHVGRVPAASFERRAGGGNYIEIFIRCTTCRVLNPFSPPHPSHLQYSLAQTNLFIVPNALISWIVVFYFFE